MSPSQYPAEAADNYCLREGEAARLLAGHPWRSFVVVGDSIAEGLGDSCPGYPEVPWRDGIAAELREQQRRLGTPHVPLIAHPASGDANIYSADLRHGTMRGHAISAAETIRRLGIYLDSSGRRAARVDARPR